MTPEPTEHAGDPWSLHKTALAMFVAVTVIFVAASGIATWGLVAAREGRNRLLDQLDPAIQHADTYLTAVVDQETGVRGYALAHSPDFLEPYHNGLAQASSAELELRSEISRLPSAPRQLTAIERKVSAWHTVFVKPLLDERQARTSNDSFLHESKDAFDGIRASFAILQQNLDRQRAIAARGFDHAYWLLVTVVIAALALVVVIVVAVGVALRRGVVGPLLHVGNDSRRVAGGEIDREVRRTGPREIAQLASDIEAMRDRIVKDLHAIDGARREMEAQGEELARSNRDLEQFAYVASHDLQEPLRKVASFCQLLAERYRDQIDDRGVQYIDFAVDGAKRMQALVSDLLAFSRVGRTSDSWQEVDLQVAVDAAVANMEQRIAESGGRVEIASELPVVRGDLSLLTALWQNLIGNSLKFHSDVAPLIRIHAERSAAGWTITTADNGIGIEPQYAERVFVIFQRLHTRDRYEGTGIGLALCRRIVEFHGGEIGIDKPGGEAAGTTIRLTLPALEDRAPPYAPVSDGVSELPMARAVQKP